MTDVVNTVAKTLHQKMAEVGREVAYVQKAGKNKGVGYSYASAEQVLGKVNEALFERGISVSTVVSLIRYDIHPTIIDKGGKPLQVATVHIQATFQDGTGQAVTAEGMGSGGDYGDKAVMKAFTAAHKYLYAGAFCISWGDDPEADVALDSEPESKAAHKAKMPPKADAVQDYPGDTKLAEIASEMATRAPELDKLEPTDYASLVEGWKRRIVACKPSATEAKYMEVVKAYKGYCKEKTDGG